MTATKMDLWCVETFRLGKDESPNPGWYWWTVRDGMVVEDDAPFGPFKSKQAALDDAKRDYTKHGRR